MLSIEQRELRHRGIGGSEAAAALGLSPWMTAFELYHVKRAPLAEESDAPWLRWGQLLEPVVRDEYARETGRAVTAKNETLRHPEPDRPWMLCTPDGITACGRLYEGKIARMGGPEWGEPGTDQVPLPYLIQVQHNMAVTGLPVADLAVLIGNSDFRVYTIAADAELQQQIAEAEAAFWQRVLDGTPPDPDWQSRRTLAALRRAYPGTDGRALEAPPELGSWRQVYDEARERAKAYDQVADGALAHLLHFMGEAATLEFPDGKVLRRKLVKRKGYVVEPSTAMDIRFVNKKGGSDE
jgi:putative phage-type endonuclease